MTMESALQAVGAATGVQPEKINAWLTLWVQDRWPMCKRLWPMFAHKFGLNERDAGLREMVEKPLRVCALAYAQAEIGELIWDVVICWFVENRGDQPQRCLCELKAKAELEWRHIPAWISVVQFLENREKDGWTPAQVVEQLRLACDSLDADDELLHPLTRELLSSHNL